MKAICRVGARRLFLLLCCGLMQIGFASVGFGDSTPEVREAAMDTSESGAKGFDREARLEQALEDYSQALAESSRDTRLAGFARAERGFASLASDGVETAALWTNLGNAALQAQHVGQAVLAYHRALRLDPEATTARQNLIHLRSRLPSWVPRPGSAEGAVPFLAYRMVAAETRAFVAALCFLLMSASIVLAVRRKEGAWRGLAIILGLGWAMGIGSLAYDALAEDEEKAVLVASEVEARSADSALAPLAFPDLLPAGVEVDLLEERAQWSRVRLANGRDIWVRSSSVERVEMHRKGNG